MNKSIVANIESSRIFGLRDYSAPALEDDDFHADADLEQLFQSAADDDRIGEDDVDDVLRDFNVAFQLEED